MTARYPGGLVKSNTIDMYGSGDFEIGVVFRWLDRRNKLLRDLKLC